MRAIVAAAVAAAACSSKAPPPNVQAVEELISRDAVGVSRQTKEMFFVLSYVRQIADESQGCWVHLLDRLTAGYQISVPGPDSYFIAEGELPRDEVIRCIPATFPIGPKVKDQGDIVAFETSIGNVYAAWRGRFVVFGKEAHVKAAIEPSAETATRWRPLVARSKAAPVWATWVGGEYAHLVGAGTTDVTLTIDKFEQTPKPFMAGRCIANYQSPTAAQEGLAFIEKWTGAGKWPVEIPASRDIAALFDRIAAAIGKMKITQTGNTVELAFDSDQLGGMEALAGAIQSAGEALGKQPPK